MQGIQLSKPFRQEGLTESKGLRPGDRRPSVHFPVTPGVPSIDVKNAKVDACEPDAFGGYGKTAACDHRLRRSLVPTI